MKLKIYVKRNPQLLEQWKRRQDGVLQRYHILPDLVHGQDKKDFSLGDLPSRRQLLAAQGETRTRFAAAYLEKHFKNPTRGAPDIIFPKMREFRDWYYQQPMSRDPQQTYENVISAAMFYYYPEHSIFILPEGEGLLTSHDERKWVAGIYRLAHEWYHSLRQHGQVITPIEEGSAEIFARRVTQYMTGATNPVYQIDLYGPFVEGVGLIAHATSAMHTPFDWALDQRGYTTPQQEWLSATLKSRLPSEKVHKIVYYQDKVNTPAQWLAAVKMAFDGGE